MEDIDIIKRVKHGDHNAFSLLVEKYHRRLLNFIYRIVGDERIVEDIGQEVFFGAYRSLCNFDEDRGTPFSAWLFIAARNRCISEIRKRRDKVFIPLDETLALRDAGRSPVDLLLVREQREAIAASLEQLREPYRSTILRSLQGASLREIAGEDGIAPGTVKSRLSRARQRMKRILNQRGGGKGYEGI